MLQKLREKTSGWIAKVIVGVIILTLGLFGLEQYLTSNVATHAARITAPGGWWVFGKTQREISQDQFRRRFEQSLQLQQQRLGERYERSDFDTVDARRRVLEQMIDEQVLEMAAARDGLAISNVQLRQEIQSIPAFQVNGRFDPAQYQLVLASQNPPQTPAGLEARLRSDMAAQLMPRELLGSAFATDADADRFIRLSEQTRDLAVLTIAPPPGDTQPVTDAQIDTWYKSHASRYESPERVALEYVDLDASKLDVPAADEAALRALYDQQQQRFAASEQRLASHILLNVAADGSNDASQKAKATALVAQARAPGTDFAALASANSEDEGSKASGGDLGWVQPGMMVEPFEKSLFALKPGGVSEPVRSEFGWHVIKLREVRSGTQKPFEQVRAELEKDYLETERERRFGDLTNSLIDALEQNPKALAPAAAAAKLPLQTTLPFGRGGGPGVASDPKVLRAAFSEAQLVDGAVSDLIDLTPTRSVMIRVAKHEPVKVLPLAQVRDRVIADIRVNRVGEAAKAKAEALLARVLQGEPLDAIAAAAGGTVQSSAAVTRTSPAIDPAIAQEAFRLPRPAVGKPSVALAKLGQERFALVSVAAVADGDPSKLQPPMRKSLEQQYGQGIGAVESRSYTEYVRKQYNVEIVEDRM